MGNEHIVELAWLKEKFELEDKYPIVADFRKRVIDPAIEEINLHSDMNISYTQVKSGRIVTGFKFSFSSKSSKKKTSSIASQHSLFLNPNEEVKKSIGISQKTTAEMDNIEHFAEARRKFGAAVSNAVPPEIIEILKSQGRW
jgi:plasmid replication initiation protein